MNAYRERLTALAPGASFDLESKIIPYDYEVIIQRLVIINKTSPAGSVRVYIGSHGYSHYIASANIPSKEPVVITDKELFLREEEYLVFEVDGVNANDVIEVLITGYERYMPA